MDSSEIQRVYKESIALYTRLAEEVEFILRPRLNASGIKIHDFSHRVKTVESIIEKTERLEVSDPFSQLKDVTGVRVVCLFLSDIERIRAEIDRSFVITDSDDKVVSLDPSSFGYMSLHLIARLKDDCSGPRYDQIKNIPFEIQVRTLAMHSWAAVSHYLDYKTDVDIPQELKRDFYALSGLFYVADKHFEIFFKARQESLSAIASDVRDDHADLDQLLNLDNTTAYLDNRFPERKPATTGMTSRMVQELVEFDVKTLKDLDGLLNAASSFIAETDRDSKLNRVGVVRRSLVHISDRYREYYDGIAKKAVEAIRSRKV